MSSTPNLLFLFTDEQRYDTLPHAQDRPGAFPPGSLRMPNLERLGESACVFEEAYCTQPVCTPSRGSILTGLWPRTHGAYDNNIPLHPGARTLPECLPAEMADRYKTAYHGKWHLGNEIFAQHGFTEWAGIEDQYAQFYSPGRDPEAKCHYNQWLRKHGFKPDMRNGNFSRGQACSLPEPFTKPAFLAETACEFLERNRTSPFIHYINFLEPHMPFFGPLTGLYEPEAAPLPPNLHDRPGEDMPVWREKAERIAREGFEWYDLSRETGWRRMMAAYMGLNTLIDKYTGILLDKLEELGLADNTIVVFTSDHGEMMGSHGLVGKQCMYQESIRVPLMIRLPGQTEPVRVRGPVSQVDLVPTLLELMGAPVPGHLQGQSRAGLLQEGKEARLEEDVVVTWNTSCEYNWENPRNAGEVATMEDVRTLVTPDGWRFSHYPESGNHELFNLREDPLERRNLAKEGACLEIVRELSSRLAAFKW
ncbi:MAG: sulfatase-like hydrolase/transferase [Oceanipulchritudo sp.]